MKYAIFSILVIFIFSCSQRSDSKEQIEEIEEEIIETVREEATQSQEKAESFGLIGIWSIPSSFGGGEIKIEHHSGTYYKNEEHDDGTVNIVAMDMIEEGEEKLFSLSDKSSDDIWVITKTGKLEVRSKEGIKYSSEAL